jgi:hypothetical protein
MEDASLDEFLGDGEDATDDDGPADNDGPAGDEGQQVDRTTADQEGPAAGVGPDGEAATGDSGGVDGDGATAAEEVEPAVTTYAWHGVGAACDACGATVGRRWRDGDGLVCRDCKEW